MPTKKGLIRSLSRRGTRSDQSPPVATKSRGLREPRACERCGAVYSRKTWRQGRPVTGALLDRAVWTVCPGCRQVGTGEYFGRVLIRGAYATVNDALIRARTQNVAERARFTQPERRIVSMERSGDTLEVLTTSQKLAHRIARELQKAFRGRVSYSWSDRDGTLQAIWERER